MDIGEIALAIWFGGTYAIKACNYAYVRVKNVLEPGYYGPCIRAAMRHYAWPTPIDLGLTVRDKFLKEEKDLSHLGDEHPLNWF